MKRHNNTKKVLIRMFFIIEILIIQKYKKYKIDYYKLNIKIGDYVDLGYKGFLYPFQLILSSLVKTKEIANLCASKVRINLICEIITADCWHLSFFNAFPKKFLKKNAETLLIWKR